MSLISAQSPSPSRRMSNLTPSRRSARAQHSRCKIAGLADDYVVHGNKFALRAIRYRWQLTPLVGSSREIRIVVFQRQAANARNGSAAPPAPVDSAIFRVRRPTSRDRPRQAGQSTCDASVPSAAPGANRVSWAERWTPVLNGTAQQDGMAATASNRRSVQPRHGAVSYARVPRRGSDLRSSETSGFAKRRCWVIAKNCSLMSLRR